MECPACDNELTAIEVGEITVDACRNGCGGIWFDQLELNRLDEQHGCRQQAEHIAQLLREKMAVYDPQDASMLGPAPAFLSRLRGRWRWHILLRATQIKSLHELLSQITLPSGWRLDIDPLDLL